MLIKLPALAKQLEGDLARLYHVFGAEPLLVEEAADTIRQSARAQGFDERTRYTAESGFDWGKLFNSGASASLFAGKTIVELRIPTGKPGDGGKALVQYADMQTNHETFLLIISGGVDKRVQTTKWFKAIEGAGVAVECPAVPAARLSAWIGERMRAKGIDFEPAAAARLGYFVEGNLLAAAQEIDLLALLYPNQKIDAQSVENVIADHARFTNYALVDACLAGKTTRALRILQGLQRNQGEPILVLAALSREVRTLCNIQAGLARGANSQSLFKKYGVWSSRNSLVSSALQRLPQRRCEYIMRQLARADLMLKGQSQLVRKNIWQEIEYIGLQICGVNLL